MIPLKYFNHIQQFRSQQYVPEPTYPPHILLITTAMSPSSSTTDVADSSLFYCGRGIINFVCTGSRKKNCFDCTTMMKTKMLMPTLFTLITSSAILC